MTRWTVFSVSFALLFNVTGAATAQTAALDQLDSKLLNGEYEAARAILSDWWDQHGDVAGVDSRLRARALMARARLSGDLEATERDYLAVVLGHPSGPYAPEALLRLGQLLLLKGDSYRAGAYLERLIRDYPGSGHRDVGRVWLARSMIVAGRAEEACAVLATGLSRAADSGLEALFQVEQRRACEPPEPDRPTGDTAVVQLPAGDYAVQLGAFRSGVGARRLADSAADAGFETRIVVVPPGSLLLVRVGSFPDEEAAKAMAERLGGAGFQTMVVDDVAKEEPG